MTAKKASADGGSVPQGRWGPVVCAHTLVTGPQAGLQAADLRTVIDPEKGSGHMDKVVLCASLLCLNDEGTSFHLRAKSNPQGQESPRGHSRCNYFAGNALRVSNVVVNTVVVKPGRTEDHGSVNPSSHGPTPLAPSHCASLLGLCTSTPTSHAPLQGAQPHKGSPSHRH